KRAGAFFGTPLIAFLKEWRIDSLIMVGESTSGCLRASVVEAASFGFPVTVVADCAFDRHSFIHQVNLLDMHLKYATVVDQSLGLALIQGASFAQSERA